MKKTIILCLGLLAAIEANALSLKTPEYLKLSDSKKETLGKFSTYTKRASKKTALYGTWALGAGGMLASATVVQVLTLLLAAELIKPSGNTHVAWSHKPSGNTLVWSQILSITALSGALSIGTWELSKKLRKWSNKKLAESEKLKKQIN
ncbi:MAG: hypothetical protein UR26_C0001G0068 [candidate division TM6 bacterium GW2011_GWF2_32_72]|nr:MAG: hypothetical protein UR26_C0001G0068 [candidate division TM6 bacterium GW2011_GWF2_32_72]